MTALEVFWWMMVLPTDPERHPRWLRRLFVLLFPVTIPLWITLVVSLFAWAIIWSIVKWVFNLLSFMWNTP